MQNNIDVVLKHAKNRAYPRRINNESFCFQENRSMFVHLIICVKYFVVDRTNTSGTFGRTQLVSFVMEIRRFLDYRVLFRDRKIHFTATETSGSTIMPPPATTDGHHPRSIIPPPFVCSPLEGKSQSRLDEGFLVLHQLAFIFPFFFVLVLPILSHLFPFGVPLFISFFSRIQFHPPFPLETSRGSHVARNSQKAAFSYVIV